MKILWRISLIAMLTTFVSVAYSDKVPSMFKVSFPYGESFYVMGISHVMEEKDARFILETLEPFLEGVEWVALERTELLSVSDYFQDNRLYPDDFVEVSVEIEGLYNSYGYCLYCLENGIIQYSKAFEMNAFQLDDDVFFKENETLKFHSDFKVYQLYGSRKQFYNAARLNFENNVMPQLKQVNRLVKGEYVLSKEDLEQLDDEVNTEMYRASERNRQWINRLKTLLFNGKGFVFVGYLHLPGKQGLIDLLKKEGAQVEEIQMPSLRSNCANPFQHYWEAQSHRPAQGGGLCVNCW